MTIDCLSSVRAGRFVAAALLASSLATAQGIVWGTVYPSVAPTDVSLDGELVVARNLHSAGAAQSPVVNGVAFVGGFSPTGWTNASTNALNGSTTFDAGYDLLLDSARSTNAASMANPTGWGGIRLDTLAPLTVGHTYSIQCWFTDQRTGGAPGTATEAGYDRVQTLGSAIGVATLTGGEVTNLGSLVQGPLSGPLDGDPDNHPALAGSDYVYGSHCTGTFTWVSASDPLWLLVQGSHPIPTSLVRSALTAFQIRDLSVAYHQVYGAGCYAPEELWLAAWPAPVFTLGGDSVPMTWQVEKLVDLAPVAPGVYLAAIAFSFNPPIGGPNGIDLTLLGIDAPGCNLLVGSIDLLLPIGAVSSSHSEPVTMPQPLGIGTTLYSQAVDFVVPNSLPNLQNNFGVITSNGLKTYFELQ